MSDPEEQPQSYSAWFYDKLGDGIINVIDEIKFWGEVVAEYMEWDESSAQRIAGEYRAQIREQLRETDDAQKMVEEHLRREDEQELADIKAEEDEQQL